MDFLKPKRYPSVIRSTSVCLEGGHRLHLQYYKFWGSNFKYRFVTSSDGRIHKGGARIPSRKHVELLWAQADLEGWADLNGEPVERLK